MKKIVVEKVVFIYLYIVSVEYNLSSNRLLPHPNLFLMGSCFFFVPTSITITRKGSLGWPKYLINKTKIEKLKKLNK